MKSNSEHIYRFDRILGRMDEDLDESLYRSWGRSLAKMLPDGSRFLVTSDNRRKSDSFKSALCDGLIEQGIHVIDLGTVPAALGGYALNRNLAKGVAAVTGCAHPATWNGLKWRIVNPEFPVRDQVAFLRDEAFQPSGYSPSGERSEGTYRTFDIYKDWITWLQGVWYDTPPTPLRVVVDPMHGNWSGLIGKAMQTVFPHMDITSIHDEPLEDFGGMVPSSREPKSLTALCEEIRRQRADIGFAFDADAGLFSIIDRLGVPLIPEEISWFFLHNLLDDALAGEKFVHDVNCPQKIIAEGRRLGAEPILVPRNEQAFVEAMNREDALIGLGSEGEIYFRGIQGNRIVSFAACWFLDALVSMKTDLTEWRKICPTFFTTSEFRVPAISTEQVASRIIQIDVVELQETVDGLAFVGPHGRTNIRIIPPDTIGFYFEAHNRQTLYRIVEDTCEALSDLGETASLLRECFQADAARRLFSSI